MGCGRARGWERLPVRVPQRSVPSLQLRRLEHAQNTLNNPHLRSPTGQAAVAVARWLQVSSATSTLTASTERQCIVLL